MPLRRPLVALVTAVTLAAGLVTIGAPAVAAPARTATASVTPAPGGYVPAPVKWKDCAKQLGAGFQCGFVKVPLNWSDVSGTKITIAVSRVRHSAGVPYQGAILTNPGGPGGSGLSLAVLKKYVPNGGGDGYDWIGFDPRGVGQSTPSLHCIAGYANGVRPPYNPFTKSIEDAWLKLSTGYAAACAAKNSAALLNHMTTKDAAKDMDAIRVALRQEQISYYGFSYGTYLGQVYTTLFPTHVKRVVFDSTVDPRGVWYQANFAQDIAFEKTINVFFTWVAKYDSVYHLGSTRAEVAHRYNTIKKELTAKPVGAVGGSEWNDLLLNAGYYQSTWLDIAHVFSAWGVQHDKKALIAGYTNYVASDDDNEYAVYDAVQCSEGYWPRSFTRYRADSWRTYASAPFETWGNSWYNAPCLYWPAKSHTPVTIDGSKVPSVLMIDETLDAATPFPGSIEVRHLYPGARLIQEPGGTSHADSLSGDACVDDQVAAYLKDGTLPARAAGDQADATCAPLPQPDPTAKASTDSAGGSGSSRGSITALRRASGVLVGG